MPDVRTPIAVHADQLAHGVFDAHRDDDTRASVSLAVLRKLAVDAQRAAVNEIERVVTEELVAAGLRARCHLCGTLLAPEKTYTRFDGVTYCLESCGGVPPEPSLVRPDPAPWATQPELHDCPVPAMLAPVDRPVVWRCGECGATWVAPQPAPDEDPAAFAVFERESRRARRRRRRQEAAG